MRPRVLLGSCLVAVALAVAVGASEEGAATAPPGGVSAPWAAAHSLRHPRRLSEEVSHKYPCIHIDADRYLPEWSCELEEATDSEKQTVEYYLSIATGSSINVGISCGFYLIDLCIAAMVHTWNFAGEAVTWVWDTGITAITTVWELIVEVIVALWNVIVEVLTWIWEVVVMIITEVWTSWFLAYWQWMLSAIPAMWEWWYVAVWDAMVIGALEAFVLLVVLAFIVYLPWAVVGVFVCAAISFVLLIIMVPLIAIKFALLTVIVFCLGLIVAIVVIVFAAVVFAFVAVLALIAIILTVLIALALLILTALLAFVVIVVLFVMSLVITVPALFFFLILLAVVVCFIYALAIVCVLAIMLLGMGVLASAAVMLMAISAKFIAWRAFGKKDPGEDIIKMVRQRDICQLCLKVWEIIVFGISDTAFFMIDLLTAATSYRIFQTLAHEVWFPNLVDGGEIVAMIQVHTPDAIKDLAGLKALEDLTYFIGTLAAYFADAMNFQCPGAAALVATSQLVMGCLFLYLIMVRDARSTISNMSVDARRVHGGSVFADIATKTLLRLLEVFIAGPAFVLLFSPHVRQTCDYVGDVVTAACAYIYLVSASFLCCAVIPKVAFGVKPPNFNDDQVFVMKKIIAMIDLESFGYAWSLLCCTVGFWTQQALDTLNGQDRIKKSQIPGERRRDKYNTVSIEFVSIVYQVLPLGGLLGKVMMACNEGFVWRLKSTEQWSEDLPDPCTTSADNPKDRFCGSCVPILCKVIGYAKAAFFIVVPLVNFDIKVRMFWFVIGVVWVGSVCSHIQPLPPVFDEGDDGKQLDTFTFDEGIKGVVDSMGGVTSAFCTSAAFVVRKGAEQLFWMVTLPALFFWGLCKHWIPRLGLGLLQCCATSCRLCGKCCVGIREGVVACGRCCGRCNPRGSEGGGARAKSESQPRQGCCQRACGRVRLCCCRKPSTSRSPSSASVGGAKPRDFIDPDGDGTTSAARRPDVGDLEAAASEAASSCLEEEEVLDIDEAAADLERRRPADVSDRATEELERRPPEPPQAVGIPAFDGSLPETPEDDTVFDIDDAAADLERARSPVHDGSLPKPPTEDAMVDGGDRATEPARESGTREHEGSLSEKPTEDVIVDSSDHTAELGDTDVDYDPNVVSI